MVTSHRSSRRALSRAPYLFLVGFGVLILAQPLAAAAQTKPPLQPTPTLAAPPTATPDPALAPTAEVSPTVASTPAPGEGGGIPQVHQVQEGENLTVIAQMYGVTVEDLMRANGLTDADVLQIGQELVIPGGEGEVVPGRAVARVGDTLAGIAADYNTTVEEVAADNRLITLAPELLAGQEVAVESRTGSDSPRPPTGRPYLVTPGDTVLGLAARFNVAPAALAAANALSEPALVFPGQRLRIPDPSVLYRDLPDGWVDIQVRPDAIGQGDTVSVYVQNLREGTPAGTLGGIPLDFTPMGSGYVALAGIDAFTEPAIYDLEVDGDGWQPLRSRVRIAETLYDTQYIEVGETLDGLLDPALRADEDAFLKTIYGNFTEPAQWSGVFQTPVASPVVSAGYGGRRSYNGGPISIYHTGIDFAQPEGSDVVAPAAGTVVFSDTLELRGNVLIIDHGLGVMTGYYHLNEILVKVGDQVTAGQVVARVGSTGLSSGAHLHWDVRILDVPVDGTEWTQQAFP